MMPSYVPIVIHCSSQVSELYLFSTSIVTIYFPVSRRWLGAARTRTKHIAKDVYSVQRNEDQ